MSENKVFCSDPEDFDIIAEAGKILMQSGAEVYRTEETMRHMASSLNIDNFDAYVVNRGIVISGMTRTGQRQARVASVPETSIHLGKIEAVNSLSRKMVESTDISSEDVSCRLYDISHMQDPSLISTLIAYFVGAGCFSFAIGSTIIDSIASAITGLIMGLVLQLASKRIKTGVLITIIGSATVTLIANLLCLIGIGQHRSLIILGALMLLIPGAVFTNSVREFSQHNHATGLTLLMSALLISLSISCGVALTTDLLPFAEQMTGVFSNYVDSIMEIITRTIMAGIGTIAFSFLFHAPRKYYIDLGLLGGASWMIYLTLSMIFNSETHIIFVPALFAALASRLLSVRRKCPITIFLSTSIFPLIPGLSFYRCVYFLMTGENELALLYMHNCFNTAFAIALSIIIIQEIRFKKKKI